MSSTDSTAARDTEPERLEHLQVAVRAAEDRKAEDVKVLELTKVSDFTDHFVLCSGSNARQVQAIADLLLERLRAAGMKPLHVEGQDIGAWILVDYGELVVHVFLDEIRSFYGLERLWSDAPDVTELYADSGDRVAPSPDAGG